MNRIASALPAVAGLAVLVALQAFAQVNQGMGTRSGTGADAPFETVVRVGVGPDSDQIVVQDAAGVRRTVLLDRTTMIERGARLPGQRPLGISDIAAGDRIVVTGTPSQDRFTAQRIQILDPGNVGAGPPGAANPASPPTGAPNTANPVGPPERPPGAARPTVPANPAQPPSGAGANPAQPPSGAGANPASPPTSPPGAAAP